MTGTQALIAFISGPVLGVLIAMRLRKTAATPVLFAALLGEAAAVIALLLWSRWALRPGAGDGQDRLVAVAGGVSLANRLSALALLAVVALGVGGLALLLHRIVVGRAA